MNWNDVRRHGRNQSPETVILTEGVVASASLQTSIILIPTFGVLSWSHTRMLYSSDRPFGEEKSPAWPRYGCTIDSSPDLVTSQKSVGDWPPREEGQICTCIPRGRGAFAVAVGARSGVGLFPATCRRIKYRILVENQVEKWAQKKKASALG
jgi:hypothetical protein